MAQQGENIIKCELSAVIDQLCLNQMEMVSRAKQSNEILKNLYATITELRAENNSLRNEVLQLRSEKIHFGGPIQAQELPNIDSVERPDEDSNEESDEEAEVIQSQRPIQGMLRLNTNIYESDEETEGDTDDDEAEDETCDVHNENKNKNEITCWGCREKQPNQLAHMDPGGCLHFVASDDEDSNHEWEINGLNAYMDEMELDN